MARNPGARRRARCTAAWHAHKRAAANTSLPPLRLLCPAGHNFCKPCLEKKFGGIADEIDAGAATGRSLRVRKVQKPCPTCKVSSGWLLQNCSACKGTSSRGHLAPAGPAVPTSPWAWAARRIAQKDPPEPCPRASAARPPTAAASPCLLPPALPQQVDICEFLKTAQANREMAAVIRKLQVRSADPPVPSTMEQCPAVKTAAGSRGPGQWHAGSRFAGSGTHREGCCSSSKLKEQPALKAATKRPAG